MEKSATVAVFWFFFEEKNKYFMNCMNRFYEAYIIKDTSHPQTDLQQTRFFYMIQ